MFPDSPQPQWIQPIYDAKISDAFERLRKEQPAMDPDVTLGVWLSELLPTPIQSSDLKSQ